MSEMSLYQKERVKIWKKLKYSQTERGEIKKIRTDQCEAMGVLAAIKKLRRGFVKGTFASGKPQEKVIGGSNSFGYVSGSCLRWRLS